MLRYPVILKRNTNDTILVTFGDDKEEALLSALDALETALSMYVDGRREIQRPSSPKRSKFVTLPALTEAKLALYAAMRTAGVGKAEMARRLNGHLPQVDRLLDLMHASRLDQIESAFRAMGMQLSIEVHKAA
jgi:antitoxin HicB